jgi:hypothetical protein
MSGKFLKYVSRNFVYPYFLCSGGVRNAQRPKSASHSSTVHVRGRPRKLIARWWVPGAHVFGKKLAGCALDDCRAGAVDTVPAAAWARRWRRCCCCLSIAATKLVDELAPPASGGISVACCVPGRGAGAGAGTRSTPTPSTDVWLRVVPQRWHVRSESVGRFVRMWQHVSILGRANLRGATMWKGRVWCAGGLQCMRGGHLQRPGRQRGVHTLPWRLQHRWPERQPRFQQLFVPARVHEERCAVCSMHRGEIQKPRR